MSQANVRNHQMDTVATPNHADDYLALFEVLFQHAPVGFAFVDSNLRYVRVNAALAAIDKFSGEQIGKTVPEVIPGLWPTLEPLYRRALAGETILNHDISGATNTGDARDWLVSYYPVRDRETVIGIGVIVNDITARKQAERSLAIRNNLYAMLSRTNQAISQCQSCDELYRAVCSIAVETGKFRFAWVGVPEDNRVKMVACAGIDQGYMNNVVITLDENDPRSHGPTGRAAITGKSFVVNDFMASPMTAPWHQNAKRVGFAASATFPFKERGKVAAILTLYASEPGFFTDELVATLSEIAPNLSFALDGYAQERDRKRTEELLRENERLLRMAFGTVSIAAFRQDKDLKYSWMYQPQLGYTTEAVIGRTDAELLPPDAAEQVTKIKQAVIKSGKNLRDEVTVCAGNTTRIFELSVEPVREGAKIVGIIGVSLDITQRKRVEAERNDLLARLQLQIDRMPIAYILYDAEIRYAGWNPAAERIFGYTREEILGRPLLTLVPPEQWPLVESIADRLRRGDVTAHSVNDNLTKDGRLITCEWHNTPLTDANGAFIGVLSMTMDVTERVRAEQALRASEERLRLALAAGRMGTFDWDITTNTIIWSDTHYQLFGYPPDDRFPVEFRHFVDRLHPDDREAVELAIQTAMRAGAAYTNECRLLLPDGTVRWVMGSGEFHYASDGQPIRMLGTVVDITDRKRDEAELQMRDRAMRAVSQGIVITDACLPDNPITYASPGFERLTGYSAAEITGRNCRFLQGEESDQATIARLRSAVRKAEGCTVELLNYRQDGTTFWNSLTISPVADTSGRVTHFVGVQTDVTERRRLEEQFRQAQKMEAVGQLAGGVAHDFNNLLTVINGYTDLLLSQLPPEDPKREYLTEVYKAGERAGTLTRQLLTFSRQQVLEMKVLNLNSVVSDTEKMLCRLIGEDVVLMTNLFPMLGLVKADAGQIAQILINLAVNARDAMPRGGSLTVETQNVVLNANACREFPDLQPGQFALLAVRDTGNGMDEATKARIFEPFFTTKEVGHGTGLGLATVHGIVKQSGGYISVDSAIGRGTTFKIYLPTVSEQQSASQDKSQLSAAPLGSETILLVEDEFAVRALAKQILRKCGYTVLEAANGLDALLLSEAHNGPIHLLVSDVVMPHVSGRDLAEQLTAKRPACKVLFLSGYTDDAVLRHGVLQEDFAFLQKPFTPALLAHKVRSVLNDM